MARPEQASRWAWLVLGLVAVLALVWGSGAFGGAKSPPATLYQRTIALAGQYRCPVCQGESVAASESSEAVEIKALIRNWIKEGRTSDQIRASLVADYGSSILERPPASGIDIVLWVLPAVVLVAGAGGLGFAFRRWRRMAPLTGAGVGAAVAVGGEVVGAGAAEAGSKLRPALPGPSFEAEQPHIEGEQGSGRPVLPLAAGRGLRGSRVTVVAGLAMMAVAGILWLVGHSGSNSAMGRTGAPSIDLELQQAAALTTKNPVAALAVYRQVLAADPGEPTALTEEGWIYSQAGLSKKGLALLGQVEKEEPSFDLAHLYRGLVLLDYAGRRAGAAKEFRFYLSHGPDPSLVPAARKALALATSG